MLLQLLQLLVVATLALAKSIHGSKTLVVYDQKLTSLDEYTQFFAQLEERNYDLHYKVNGKDELSIFGQDDKRLYDNVIIMPVKTRTLGKALTGSKLLQFFKEGGDVMVVSDENGVSEPVRVFANELGIFPSTKGYKVVDHFHHGETHDVLEVAGELLKNEHVYKKDAALVYKGASAMISNGEQIVPILSAPRTSYNKDSSGKEWVSGSQGQLVVGFQGLNNARAVWMGSAEMLKDTTASANGEFVAELCKWTFREKAVLDIVFAEHSHVDSVSYAERPYKIKDAIIYNIAISEWTGEKWTPYEASDVQLEVQMIDPYYRLNLNKVQETEHAAVYSSGEFNLPDHHGVFSFITNYKRSGLSFIEDRQVMAIRHLANDEYLRSWEISNSFVYLTSIGCVISAWLVFVVAFLYTGEQAAPSKKNL